MVAARTWMLVYLFFMLPSWRLHSSTQLHRLFSYCSYHSNTYSLFLKIAWLVHGNHWDARNQIHTGWYLTSVWSFWWPASLEATRIRGDNALLTWLLDPGEGVRREGLGNRSDATRKPFSSAMSLNPAVVPSGKLTLKTHQGGQIMCMCVRTRTYKCISKRSNAYRTLATWR